MNPHLNIFNNYREEFVPKENNLTRAFIITLKNEPQLLRDFLFMVSGDYTWDDVTVSIQDKNIDISGFEKVIGLALTSQSIGIDSIDSISDSGSETPIPDFLLYNGKTLIVGEVKKHSENPIAQLKNQLKYLVDNRTIKDKEVNIEVKALSWTNILSKLIIPYINFNKKNNVKTIWASEFKDYISIHYSDWLPVPTLDKIDFTTEKDSVTRQFIEKRLYKIQCLTKFGQPQYWVGGRMTMPLNFGWATEAQVILSKHHNKDFVQINIWPADTKAQGNQIFNRTLNWANQTTLTTPLGSFDLSIIPYIKFSHVMGKWIGAINFTDELLELGKKFHNKKNFEVLSRSWDRSQWNKLTTFLDNQFSDIFDWKEFVEWDEKFEESGRNFVFISMGFECSIFVPFELFQRAEKEDPSGVKAAELLNAAIYNFRNLVNNG